MLNSKKVYREIPFNIELRSTEVFKELDNSIYDSEIVLLQGVIDCYFEEGESLFLLDYKTDFVPNGGIHTIKNRYKLQMDYYRMALQKLTGKRVDNRVIYLFYNDQIIEY
jgi:ATP-dependent helicase/nuclease subunit A